MIAGSNAGAAINVVGHIEHMLNAGDNWTGTIGFAALDDGALTGRISMSAGYVITETLGVVNSNSYLRVQLADGRIIGTNTAPLLTGNEKIKVEVGGVIYDLNLDTLKTWVTS